MDLGIGWTLLGKYLHSVKLRLLLGNVFMKSLDMRFIVGPTASGKTELSLRVAETVGGVILSCDSLCFYRGMDIGTAKPSREEQGRVPHYGIDLVDPQEAYSVGRFIAYRDDMLARMEAEGRPVIVVGGSGFYLKSFFAPVVDSLEIPAAVTEQVARLKATGGLPALLEALREVNPPEERFDGLDLKNPRRVEKALMRCLASGASYGALRAAFAAHPAPLRQWKKEVWLVERDPAELHERNLRRARRMLEEGLVEEVERLRAHGFERNPSACRAIGYREVLEYLDGDLPHSELESQIVTHTQQLMRKQRTWFRHHLPVDRRIGGSD